MLDKLLKIADHLDKVGLPIEAEVVDSLIMEVSAQISNVYITGDVDDSTLFNRLKARAESSLPINFVMCNRPDKSGVSVNFKAVMGHGSESITVRHNKHGSDINYVLSKEDNVDNYINYLIEDIKVGLNIK